MSEVPAPGVAGADPLEEEALRRRAGVVPLDRDFVLVAGDDAASYLQGQLAQDLAVLAVGESAWSLLLQPQGRLDALVRVTRTDETSFVLDTDGGWGAHVQGRVERFLLRVAVEVSPLSWQCLAVRGPAAASLVIAAAADGRVEGHVVPAWPAHPGVDVVGPAPAVSGDELQPCSLGAYEVVRIEAGVPVMGLELDERTIPAEAGVVEHAVSFTKGCFTGQELVARIDSRGGNVPRHLRGLVMPGLAIPPAGATVSVGDEQVGSVTSGALSRGRGVAVALAYAKRGVTPPVDVVVAWDGARHPARLVELPFGPASGPGAPGSGPARRRRRAS